MNKKKSLMKNTIIIFVGKLCTQLISFFLLPLYTSYLTTSDYGIVDLITTYVTLLVPLITMELEMSIFRFLVDARGKDKDTKTLMSNNYYILSISLVLFSILYWIVCLFWKFDYQFIIWIDIIICLLSGNLLQVTRGFGKTLDFSISCIITGVMTIVSNIVLILGFNMGAPGMIISMAVANGLGALYLFIRLKLYKYFTYKLVDKKLIKDMYAYSIPIVPNGISWWIVNVSDRTIINVILGAASNGLYAISNKFPTLLSSLLGIFNLSWTESAALHIDSEDRDEFFSDIVNTVTKLFSCFGVGMIACMPFLFYILINDKFYEGIYYVPFLVLGAVFNVVACLYSGIYLAKKDSKIVSKTSVIAAVINIVLNLVLIKFIGLYAAALSTTIAYFVMMIYRHFDIKRYVNIKFDKGLIIKSILIYSLSIFLFYQENIYLNIINLVIVVIYSIILNKEFLMSCIKTITSKLKRS